MVKITLAGVGIVIIGVGSTIAGMFLPETQWILVEHARIITIGGIVFMVIGVGLLGVSLIRFLVIKKRKHSLKITVHNVSIGSRLMDNGQDIIQFLISLTLKASAEIKLGKLDLVYDGRPYTPTHGLPTSLVKGAESYEVEYRVYGEAGQLLILMGVFEAGGATESQLPQVHLCVMAGELDFTEPVQLVSRREDYQT